MGSKRRSVLSKADGKAVDHAQRLSAARTAVDPVLAALFETSLNETKPESSRRFGPQGAIQQTAKLVEGSTTSEDASAEGADSGVGESRNFEGVDRGVPERVRSPLEQIQASTSGSEKRSRKRPRIDGEDDIEGAYMNRLAQEEARENAKRHQEIFSKRQKVGGDVVNGEISTDEEDNEQADDQPSTHLAHSLSPPPQHETTTTTNTVSDPSIEQATRTIFLANVSTTAITSRAAYTILTNHLSQHLSSLPPSIPSHKVESLRFRSTAYATSSLPKRAAFAKKALMDSTTKSTNAYVVYTTALAAREAVKNLNGTTVLDRHLRVDGVAHPMATDHRRCVFVGNLGFVDDESAIRAAEDEENGAKKVRKQKKPADVEEGLWRQFEKAGAVESVRVIRDKSTRVGKGFAYVQFKDPNSVERALLYNSKSFPPLLPRSLRVTRAKNIAKTASYGSKASPTSRSKLTFRAREGVYTPKPSSQFQSLSGRAGKLLGRAGAAKWKSGKVREDGRGPAAIKTPERIIFEGHRAKGGQKPDLGKGKKSGKPKTRSSKRGAAFKASGGQKKRG